MRSTTRRMRAVGIAAVTAMIGALLGVTTLASPAGAAPATVIYDCGIPLAPGTTAPIPVQFDGTAPTAVRPDAASVSTSGVTATVILDPTFVAGLLQGFIDAGFPAPATIDLRTTVGLASNGPVSPANSAPQGPLVSLSGPQAPNPAGNSFTFPLANVAFTNTGAVDGDVANFLPGAASGAAFVLLAQGIPLPIDINGCILANGVTGPGANPPSGAVSPPVAPFASTLFENAAPVAQPQNVQVIKNSPKAITLTATDDVSVASYAVTQPANGTVTVDNAATGAVTYTPNTDFEGADSFTFTATDNEGKVSPVPGVVSLTVVGGDSKDQIINQEIIGDRLFLDQMEDGVVTMDPVTLTGFTQNRVSAIDNLRVRDARGDETTGWDLDAKLLGDFVNQRTGTSAALPGGSIPMANLSMNGVQCTVLDGAPVAQVSSNTAGGNFAGGAAVPMCSAAGPTSGGAFSVDALINLVVPPYVYTGNYQATMQFTVQ